MEARKIEGKKLSHADKHELKSLKKKLKIELKKQQQSLQSRGALLDRPDSPDSPGVQGGQEHISINASPSSSSLSPSQRQGGGSEERRFLVRPGYAAATKHSTCASCWNHSGQFLGTHGYVYVYYCYYGWLLSCLSSFIKRLLRLLGFLM